MKAHQGWLRRIAVFTAALPIFFSSGVVASEHQPEKKPEREVMQEAVELYGALKAYAVDQRDDAMAIAEERLAKLDRKIDALEETLDRRWQKMNDAARSQARQMLKSLRTQRNEAAEWLGGMRHSSDAAWEDVKKGFADSYVRLEKAFSDAKRRFED